jgi:hypothetical protein
MLTALTPPATARRRTGQPRFLRRSRLGLLLLLLATLAACTSEEAQPEATTPADTGTVVVENDRPSWAAGQAWRVGPDPSLDIVTLADNPNELLEFVRGAVRLGDGRIVVANGGTNELRTYGPDGQFMFSRGGFGTSPDEFRQIGEVVPFGGDSVAVNDWGSGRAVVYKPSAEWARDFRLPDLGPDYVPLLLGRFPDGTVLVGTGDRIDPSRTQLGVARKPVVFLRADAQGSVLDSIGRFPGDELFVISRGGGRIQAPALPFGRTTETGLVGDGVAIGSSDSYEISVFSPDGQLQRVVRKSHAPVPVTVESFRILADRRVSRIPDEALRAERRQELLDMPIPETMPAFGLLIGDSEGYMWVQEYVTPGEPTVDWSVFGPDGVFLGTVTMPSALRPKQIGSDFVLGVLVDELGIEHVQLYSLART